MTFPDNTLDPQDWDAFRKQAHRMLDDIIDHTRSLRDQPVWRPAPDEVRASFFTPLPRQPAELAAVHRRFTETVLPYGAGNAHPGFMGWVQGGGNPVGMVAEMLAAGLNANLGGRDQVPIQVEQQVLRWVRELFEFPDTASGLFVTGTSMANLMAVLIARTAALGSSVRREGLAGHRLVAYTSISAHGCVSQALDLSGLGKDALRLIPVDADHRMDLAVLQERIARDREAGSVDVGAVDDLQAIAEIARREKLWFHIDGAFGALGMLSPEVAPKLRGLQQADSVAFDFHKWGQVPYDAGFLIVRDGRQHQETFASPVAYLRRESRGLAAGSPWPCDFGPDLSRGFRALKTWFTLQVHGADQLGRVIANTCALAQRLKQGIEREPRLELLAPVALNVVCFRYRFADKLDERNADLVVALQESGLVVPSSTTVDGHFAIRAAIVNHRTAQQDIDTLLATTLRLGDTLARSC
jgi:glutamate/tyrosine decarboxylase-like PLP-dependent enzyme